MRITNIQITTTVNNGRFQVTCQDTKASSDNQIQFTCDIACKVLQNNSIIDSIYKFILTLFNWKWIEIKTSDTNVSKLLNINSLSKHIDCPKEIIYARYQKDHTIQKIFHFACMRRTLKEYGYLPVRNTSCTTHFKRLKESDITTYNMKKATILTNSSFGVGFNIIKDDKVAEPYFVKLDNPEDFDIYNDVFNNRNFACKFNPVGAS